MNIIGNGTVFKLAPRAKGQTAWTESVLYSFKGGPSDGGNPSAGLIADNDGALYGPTVVGGTSGFGTVFKLTPPGEGRPLGQRVCFIVSGATRAMADFPKLAWSATRARSMALHTSEAAA